MSDVSVDGEKEGDVHAQRREAGRLALGRDRSMGNRRPLVQIPAGVGLRTGHPTSTQLYPMKKHYRALSAERMRTPAELLVSG